MPAQSGILVRAQSVVRNLNSLGQPKVEQRGLRSAVVVGQLIPHHPVHISPINRTVLTLLIFGVIENQLSVIPDLCQIHPGLEASIVEAWRGWRKMEHVGGSKKRELGMPCGGFRFGVR